MAVGGSDVSRDGLYIVLFFEQKKSNKYEIKKEFCRYKPTLGVLLVKGEGALVSVLVNCFRRGTLLDLEGGTSGLLTWGEIGVRCR